ncbi:hypothetical protein LTS18_006359 [Coniosporium uncinatum]|uniref:Uncharacterized protein n=1 Tax=Coniosporium uncinatum TaxID=93489 RepID=A0ACC3D3U8_9PEZI|nr:hypothetical protein LTS18_006359 [Coniosporium uncinatum]
MKPVNVTAPGFLEKTRPHLSPEQIEDLRRTERLHLAHPEQPERFAELTNAVHVMEANIEPPNLTASDIAATRANHAPWYAARAWGELVKLNPAVLRGESEGMDMIGKLWEETAAILPQLLRLHEYGALTTMSQPGAKYVLKASEGESKVRGLHGSYGLYRGHEYPWVEAQHKPFVRFFLPRAGGIVDHEALNAFLESLKARKQLGCAMVGIFPEPEDLWPRDEEDMDLAAASTTYLASRHRVAATEEGLEEAQFPNPRTLGCFLSMLTRRADTYKDCEWRQWAIEAAVDAEMMAVEVMPWEWDTELDLLKMIEDLMIQAGMRRLYHTNTLSNVRASIIRNACYYKGWLRFGYNFLNPPASQRT